MKDKKRRLPRALSGAFLLLLTLVCGARASAPSQLSYQGRLKEAGLPVTGVRSVDIQLCPGPTGGGCTDTGSQNVQVINGLFRSTFTLPSSVALQNGPWFLEVQVGGQAFVPREMLGSSPYAVYASSAATLIANPGAGYVVISTGVSIQGQDAAGYSLVLSSGLSMGAGTVTAQYFVGNGGGITGIVATSVLASGVQNGTLNAGVRLNAGSLINGPVSSAILPSTVAYTSSANTFASSQTIIAAGGASVTYGLSAGSMTVTGGLTASSGTFTATGNAQYSLVTSSGVNVLAGGVTAPFFVGDGAGLTGITATNVTAAGVQNGSLGAGVIASSVAINAINSAAQLAATLSIPDSNLSSNVELLNAGQTVTGAKIFSAASGLNVTYNLSAGSMTVTGGLTASSGTFTATGNAQYSLVTSSGVNVLAGGVTAPFFVGNGAGLTGVTAGSLPAGGLFNGPIASAILPSTVAYTSVANTFASSQTITAADGAMISYGLRAGSMTLTGGLTASSGTFTAAGDSQYSLVTSSGINVAAGGVTAAFFIGNGAALANVIGTDTTKVAKTGDAMTGPLTLSGSTLTVTGNAFSVGGSTLVVLSGNVGIGTANPSSTLHVVGSATITGYLSASSATFTNIGGYSLLTSSGIKIDSGGLFTPWIQASSIYASTLTVTGNAFSVGGSTLAVLNGNVGIGTADPVSKLHLLSGDLRISTPIAGPSRGIYFQDGSYQITAAGSSQWSTNATHIYKTNAGNVGIGTTDPASALHVVGGITVSSGLTASSGTFTAVGPTQYSLVTSSGISVTGTGGVTAAFFAGDGTGLTNVVATDTTKVAKTGDVMTGPLTLSGSTLTVTGSAFSVGGATLAVLAGNVGIGTADPSQRLHVIGSATISGLVSVGSMTVTGKVGIGTTDPASALHVVGGMTVSSGLTASSGTFTAVGPTQYSLVTSSGISVTGTGGVTAAFFAGDGTGLTNVVATDTTKVAKTGDVMTGPLTLSGSTLTVTGSGFSVGGSTLAVLSGNVGIGTANPSSTLHVVGSATISGQLSASSATFTYTGGYSLVTSSGIKIDSGGLFTPQIQTSSMTVNLLRVGEKIHVTSGTVFLDVGSSLHVVGSATVSGVLTASSAIVTENSFSVGGSTLVVLAGNVGIGTADPSQRLHVIGSATISGLVSVGSMTVTGRVGIGTTTPSFDLSFGRGERTIAVEDGQGANFTIRASSSVGNATPGGNLILQAGSSDGISSGATVILKPGNFGTASAAPVEISGSAAGAAHLKAFQADLPTVAAPINCGGGSPTAAIGSGSTDMAGLLSITNPGGGGTTCDTTVTFKKTYTNSASNKLKVLVTPRNSQAALRQAYAYPADMANSASFTVAFTVNPSAADTYEFSYIVIE